MAAPGAKHRSLTRMLLQGMGPGQTSPHRGCNAMHNPEMNSARLAGTATHGLVSALIQPSNGRQPPGVNYEKETESPLPLWSTMRACPLGLSSLGVVDLSTALPLRGGGAPLHCRPSSASGTLAPGPWHQGRRRELGEGETHWARRNSAPAAPAATLAVAAAGNMECVAERTAPRPVSPLPWGCWRTLHCQVSVDRGTPGEVKEAEEAGEQGEGREERRAQGEGGGTEVLPVCTECGSEAMALLDAQPDSLPLDLFLCHSCGSLLPLDQNLDFFQLFGLEPGFHVSTSALEQRYKQLQRLLHPDKYAGTGSRVDQERSADWSSFVIGAYYTLLRPLSRAKYLLKGRAGASFENEEGTVEDQELLLEIMEAREEVEGASKEQLQVLKEKFQGQMQALGEAFAKSFQMEEYSQCIGLVHRMTYCARILQEIENLL